MGAGGGCAAPAFGLGPLWPGTDVGAPALTPAPVAQAPQPAVVFDVDGTVLDGAPAMLGMYRKAAAARRAGKRAVDLFIPELDLGAGRTLHCHFGRK